MITPLMAFAIVFSLGVVLGIVMAMGGKDE